MISIATMGKYWYIQEFSGGGDFAGMYTEGAAKRKPVVRIGNLYTEDLDCDFEILKIEEEIL